MFVANGQKFILLPATCLHQVLPHTPQHQSYRFFMVFHQTSDFNMFHRDLRDAWTTMCCQDLGPTTGRTFASMTFFTSCKLAQSLYALRLTSTWWGIQKIFKAWKNITLGKKYLPRVFYVCFLAFCGTCSVLELEPFANMVLHGIGPGKHSFACFVSILGAFS